MSVTNKDLAREISAMGQRIKRLRKMHDDPETADDIVFAITEILSTYDVCLDAMNELLHVRKAMAGALREVQRGE